MSRVKNKVQLRRDPFARRTLLRERVTHENRTCNWCGSRARFVYGWESDDSRGGVSHTHAFCGVDCWESYWDERRA